MLSSSDLGLLKFIGEKYDLAGESNDEIEWTNPDKSNDEDEQLPGREPEQILLEQSYQYFVHNALDIVLPWWASGGGLRSVVSIGWNRCCGVRRCFEGIDECAGEQEDTRDDKERAERRRGINE